MVQINSELGNLQRDLEVHRGLLKGGVNLGELSEPDAEVAALFAEVNVQLEAVRQIRPTLVNQYPAVGVFLSERLRITLENSSYFLPQTNSNNRVGNS